MKKSPKGTRPLLLSDCYMVNAIRDARKTKHSSIKHRKEQRIGDILYVQERWREAHHPDGTEYIAYKSDHTPGVRYNNRDRFKCCDGHAYDGWPTCDNMGWKSAQWLPRDRARFFVEITGIYSKKIQDIKAHEAMAHGFTGNPTEIDKWCGLPIPVVRFRHHWDIHHRLESQRWSANPDIEIIEFRPVATPLYLDAISQDG